MSEEKVWPTALESSEIYKTFSDEKKAALAPLLNVYEWGWQKMGNDLVDVYQGGRKEGLAAAAVVSVLHRFFRDEDDVRALVAIGIENYVAFLVEGLGTDEELLVAYSEGEEEDEDEKGNDEEEI